MSESYRLPRWVRAFVAGWLAGPVRALDPVKSRSACLYKVDRIGDFVIATGAVRMLQDHFGAANCRLVVSNEVAPFAAAEFPNVTRWTVPANVTGVWREMRPLRKQVAAIWGDEQFDTLVCLRHARSLYRDLSLMWIRAAQWQGLGPLPARGNLALGNRPRPAAGYPDRATLPWSRELLAHRAVVAQVLGREPAWEEIRPRISSMAARNGSEVLLCPFGNDPIRDYSLASWIAGCREAFDPFVRIRVLGLKSRAAELEQHAAELRRHYRNVESTADASPAEFIRRIAEARLILTVESATAHLATALDKPTVIMMGGGHFGWFGPWGDSTRQRWLHRPLECYDCGWECRRTRVECLTDIPPPEVAQAIKELLADG